MGFPSTAVLTTFAGGDENPLSEGGNWPANVDTDNDGDLQLISNQAAAATDAGSSMYWNATFGPDTEAHCNFTASNDSQSARVYLRLADAGTTTPDGYMALFFYNAALKLLQFWRLDNGTLTQLGSNATISLTLGDQIGARIIGSTFEAFRNGTSLATRTDTTYTAAGPIGLGANHTSVTMDSFGGGTALQGSLHSSRLAGGKLVGGRLAG